MMRGLLRSVCGALAASALMMAGGCVWSSPLVVRDIRIQAAHSGGGPIDVRTDNGGIEISKGGGDAVVIDATVRARTQERADATTLTAEHSSEGAFLVRVNWPDGGRLDNEGCSMRIVLSGADGVRAATINGPISIADLAGPAELTTSNASVSALRHRGPVRADTSNGPVTVRDATGDVLARASNGVVRVTGATGRVEVDTSNGSVEIALAPTGTGPVRAATSNGSINLTVGTAFTGRLRADTSNGGIRATGVDRASISRLDATHADLSFGSGGEESRLRTSNGSIGIRGGQ